MPYGMASDYHTDSKRIRPDTQFRVVEPDVFKTPSVYKTRCCYEERVLLAIPFVNLTLEPGHFKLVDALSSGRNAPG